MKLCEDVGSGHVVVQRNVENIIVECLRNRCLLMHHQTKKKNNAEALRVTVVKTLLIKTIRNKQAKFMKCVNRRDFYFFLSVYVISQHFSQHPHLHYQHFCTMSLLIIFGHLKYREMSLM